MIQTESPYYQVNPPSPGPFNKSIGVFSSDPTFADCDPNNVTCAIAWAVRIVDSHNIYMYGAGLYSWFDEYNQTCLLSEHCQDKGTEVVGSSQIWIYNLVTKAIAEMISPYGTQGPLASDNQNGYCASLMAWLGGALNGGSQDSGLHKSPVSATIISLPCTSVPPHSTFTLNNACATNIAGLGDSGSGNADAATTSGSGAQPTAFAYGVDPTFQNIPPGPNGCTGSCDFYRLITGTCCGYGGSVGNPIFISPGVQLPVDIPLPAGYTPTVSFNSTTGVTVPAGVILTIPEAIPAGTTLDQPGMTLPSNITLLDTDPAGVQDNESPDNVLMLSLPCTKIYPSQTFTMSSACLSGIANLPTSGPNNKPPGPRNCHTHCSLLRLLTGTCCGHGGRIGFSIIIPPRIPIPKFFILPPRLRVQPPITVRGIEYSTIPFPGLDIDPESEFDNEIIIPIGSELPEDPPAPSDGEPECDGVVCCDEDVSDETGFCDNGNFPIMNFLTGEMNCNEDDADTAMQMRSACQVYADNNPDIIQDLVNLAHECPKPSDPDYPSPSCVKHDSISGLAERDWPIYNSQNYRNQWCHLPEFPWPVAGKCDATYTCMGDALHFPQICANANSAINARGKSDVITLRGTRVGLRWTQSLYANRFKGSDVTNDPGWDINGCNVEEYPHGSTYVVGDNSGPVLRLVEKAENSAHANHWSSFLESVREFYGPNGLMVPPQDDLRICYAFVNTKGANDQDWGLLDQNSNMCGIAEGPGFLLEGVPPGVTYTTPGSVVTTTLANLGVDPWLIAHNSFTVDAQGTTWGPRWCNHPARGVLAIDTALHEGQMWKTLRASQWPNQYHLDLTPNADPLCQAPSAEYQVYPTEAYQQDNTGGGQLAPPSPFNKRETVHEDEETLQPGNFSISRHSNGGFSSLVKRSLGSYLDANLYKIIPGCDIYNNDDDPCAQPDNCLFSISPATGEIIDSSNGGTGAGANGGNGPSGGDGSGPVTSGLNPGAGGGIGTTILSTTTIQPPPVTVTATPGASTPVPSSVSSTNGQATFLLQVFVENRCSGSQNTGCDTFRFQGVPFFDTSRDPCTGVTWQMQGSSTDTPSNINGITNVFGDTCNFGLTEDVSGAQPGDVVGVLNCNKYAQATCRKGRRQYNCGVNSVVIDTIYVLTECTWGSS